MKTAIHPKWHQDATVTCTCGNTFTVGATFENLQVEVCAKCHPFYTGQMKYVDAAGRVDAFKERSKLAQKKVLSKALKRDLKKKKRITSELAKPDTLEDIRKQLKLSKKKAQKN